MCVCVCACERETHQHPFLMLDTLQPRTKCPFVLRLALDRERGGRGSLWLPLRVAVGHLLSSPGVRGRVCVCVCVCVCLCVCVCVRV